MNDQLILRNNLKEARHEKNISQTELAKMVARYSFHDVPLLNY